MLNDTLQTVQFRIEEAKERSDRKEEVQILGVTKGQSDAKIIEGKTAGISLFGENYVQEAIGKIKQFSQLQWHFIGRIQSNKCKELVELFDVVQTVSRNKEIDLLDAAAGEVGRTLGVYLQWDPGVEDSKAGAHKTELPMLAEHIAQKEHLILEGLMMMTPNVPNAERRAYFREARSLFETLRAIHPTCKILSMGMSDDFLVAVEEGSTMVRLGRKLFGKRD